MSNRKIINKKTVRHIARLSRINLSDEEVKQYTAELAAILGYIGQLGEARAAVPPTSHPLESLKNVFREDIKRKSLPAEQALQCAPGRKGNFFSVPKIID